MSTTPPTNFPSTPVPTLTVLENGLRVLVVERKATPLVAIELRVRAGTAYETPENNGVAHFIEHLLFKGTASRKPGDIDAAVEAVGGELRATTSKDWARFGTVVPAGAWKTALEVLADAVQRPAFRSEDIENERRVILAEMATFAADPTQAPFAALGRVVFPEGHPYRLPLHGTEENVRRLNRDDLVAFWRARYVPRNMTLVVVGDIQRADVEGAARALLASNGATADLPAPPVQIPDPGALPAGITRADPIPLDRNLVTVVVGFRAPSVRDAEDSVAMDVLLQILSGGGRGRLNDALIRTGRALAVSADYLTQRAPGMLALTAVGRRGTESALEAALIREVRRLREDGVGADEVAQARRALRGQILFDEETFAGQANSLGFYDAIDSYEFSLRYSARVAATEATDVGRVIRRYLTPDSYGIAVAVPRAVPAPPSPPPAGLTSRVRGSEVRP